MASQSPWPLLIESTDYSLPTLRHHDKNTHSIISKPPSLPAPTLTAAVACEANYAELQHLQAPLGTKANMHLPEEARLALPGPGPGASQDLAAGESVYSFLVAGGA